jgi:TorA maturation chaperone TorD
LLFQRKTFQVRDWYARFGLTVPNLHREPDDHIGLELSFLAHLAELALRAIQAHEQERFQEALEAQRRFLAEHVLTWGPGWCSRVEATSASEFYRGLALLARGALSELSERLAVPIPTQPGA